MNRIIYHYRSDLTKKDPLISQGDVFCNLPIFTYDLILRKTLEKNNKFDDESERIFREIIDKGNSIRVEGFYNPQWGILASQDCDIRPNKDLIFYPLIQTKSLKESDNIADTLNKNVENTTRTCYLPKILNQDRISYSGPFEILFYNPFNVPFNIIQEKLDKTWVARVIEPARKVIIGKLTHFYSRTPFDSIMFLDNQEITLFMNKKWEKFWKIKDKENEFRKLLAEIEEAKSILEYVDRSSDIKEIVFYGKMLIHDSLKYLTSLTWIEGVNEMITQCNEYLKMENSENDARLFEEIIDKIYLNDNSFQKSWNNWFIENKEKLFDIIEEKNVENFIPEEITNPRKWASNTKKAVEEINKLLRHAAKFKDIFKILET